MAIEIGDDGLEAEVEDLAQLLSITRRRVQQLAELGIVRKLAHGRYDVNQSVPAYCDYLKNVELGQDDKAARTRLTKIKGDLAELEHAQLVGQLVKRETIRQALASAGTVLKNNILSAPDRLAALLAAESDAKKVHKLLYDEMVQTLNQVIEGLDAVHVDEADLDITRRRAHDQLQQLEAGD